MSTTKACQCKHAACRSPDKHVSYWIRSSMYSSIISLICHKKELLACMYSRKGSVYSFERSTPMACSKAPTPGKMSFSAPMMSLGELTCSR